MPVPPKPSVDDPAAHDVESQLERRTSVRLHFEPQEAIPIGVELPTSRTLTAQLVDISLEGLGLRLSSPADARELDGDWLVRFPTLDVTEDSLRFRVVYWRPEALGLWVGLSLVPSNNGAEHEKARRLMRVAVISMHKVRMAQWLLDRERRRDLASGCEVDNS